MSNKIPSCVAVHFIPQAEKDRILEEMMRAVPITEEGKQEIADLWISSRKKLKAKG